MKVEGFRTNEFRNIINQIANSKGYTDKDYSCGKIIYNIRNNGEVKPISICGVSDDYLAYFKLTIDNGDLQTTTPIGITYSEYISFKRDISISEVFGEKIQIKDRKPTPKEPDFIPYVGQLLRLSHLYGNSEIVKVIKVTNKQFKYKIHNREYTAKLNKYGTWFDGQHCFFHNDAKTFDFDKEMIQNEWNLCLDKIKKAILFR